MRTFHRPSLVDPAGRILDDVGFEPRMARIEGGPGDAEIRGEANAIDALEAPLDEVPGEPGSRRPIGLHETRIAVDRRVVALAEDEFGRDVELLRDVRAPRALDAVIRPQHLCAVREFLGVERLPTGMARCK